jgi:predicted ribosome quality control (RQC) complex YloA/Tae2 family protein
LNFEILSPVVEELANLLTNARVERVYQGGGGGLYLLLHRERQKFILLISPDRAMPRLHLMSTKPVAENPPHGFILFLRSRISRARVTGVGLLNQDRVVEIRFRGQEDEYHLLFELFGSSANMVLVDPSWKILAVYYPMAPDREAARSLQPGLTYHAPDKPRTAGPKENELFREFSADAAPNRAAELYYENLVERRNVASLRGSLSSLLNNKLSKNERLMSALNRETRSTEQLEEYRRHGDLILANLKNLRTGMERSDLTGFDGQIVSVTLDPTRSPSRNAEQYFKKYKKAKAGRDIIAGLLQKATEEVSYFGSLLVRLDRMDNAEELIEIRSELEAKGYGGPKKTARKKSQPGPASSAFKKIKFKGWEILVGRSAAGNDFLTMKLARPDDLWLHADGMPGSHVLVRNPNAGDIPPAVLVKAAALAAFHSKGKHAGKVPVTYSRAGLIKKPKGAKPGLVTLRERKTLMVKPEDE